ncbi:hypothetical protein [Litoribacter populi]|uniref:hypothetical protein n=1 Tax=Litoribacter populi TaxID=2598460 RepID=UPI003742E6C6
MDKSANHCISVGNLEEAAELLKRKIQENPFDTSTVISLVGTLNRSGKGWDGQKYAQLHAEVMKKE